MATVKFYLRNNTINIRFSWSRETPFRKSLKIEIPDKSWDEKRQRLRDIAIVYKYRRKVNNNLTDIENWFSEYSQNNRLINKAHLSKAFELYLNPEVIEDSFIAWVEHFIKNVAPNQINKKTKRKVAYKTIQAYNTVLGYLKKYNPDLLFSDIDTEFHADFITFLESKDLSLNTIGGYIRKLKVFINQSKKGIDLSDFYIPTEETHHIALNEAEINSIYEHDFRLNPRYENVRDWSIIGFWTGLRVSDWNRLGKIENGLITIKTQKTGKGVVIPLHWQIKEILEKRGLPTMVSNVEFNKVIKWVCRDVGLKEEVYGSRRNPDTNRKEVGMFEKHFLVSSHTCRRSFCTIHYNLGVNPLILMNITGHTQEKTFLNYIKVTPKEHALQLKYFWDKHYSK